MNKKMWIGVIVLVLALLAWWLMSSKPASAPTAQNDNSTGTANIYTQQLDGLNQTDINAEFQATDSQVNKL